MGGPHHGLPVLDEPSPPPARRAEDIVSADEIAHVRRLMAALTRRDQLERPAPS